MNDAEFIEITEAAAHIARGAGLSGDQLVMYDELIRLCALARKGREKEAYAEECRAVIREAVAYYSRHGERAPERWINATAHPESEIGTKNEEAAAVDGLSPKDELRAGLRPTDDGGHPALRGALIETGGGWVKVHRLSPEGVDAVMALLNPVHAVCHADLIAALRSGQQADPDGVMVKVSRQACEEAAALLEGLHSQGQRKEPTP